MRRVLTLFLLTVVCAGPSFSDEGREPIHAAATTISAPGHFVVTRNLTNAGGSIVTIDADDVTLDLNGFVLDATGSSSSEVIRSSAGVSGLTIRNGKILGGGVAVSIDNALQVVIEDLEIDGAVSGILIQNGMQYAVRRNLIRNVTTGIDGSGGDHTPRIEDNVIESAEVGITLSGATGGAVTGNRLRDCESNGIGVSGSSVLVTKNTLYRSGIFAAGSKFTVSGNVVASTMGSVHGVDIDGDDNYVLDNLVTGAADLGVMISGSRNHLEGNVANLNGSFGFVIDGNLNVYRRNTARGNGGVDGVPFDCSTACSPDLCIVDGSTDNTSLGDNQLPGPPLFPACI
jgi:hypothetical protein